MEIELFKSNVNVLKRFLDSQKLDFMVVGSGALLICGFPLGREPHDIDVEVQCTEEQEKVLKTAADLCGNNFYETKEEYPEITGFDHKPYIFQLPLSNGKIIVNAWAVRKFTHKQFVTSDDVKYATVTSVLRRKMAYKRIKDYRDANAIISNIISIVEGK